jgi:uncharacterized lipoprotein YmbA
LAAGGTTLLKCVGIAGALTLTACAGKAISQYYRLKNAAPFECEKDCAQLTGYNPWNPTPRIRRP